MFNTWELLVDMLDAGKVGLDKYIGAEMSMWKYQTALDEFNNIIGRAILIP
jgi:hypothetical protein